MKTLSHWALVFLIIFEVSNLSCCKTRSEADPKNNEYQYVGEMIEKTRQVFEGTGTQSDFDQVVEFGRDTRYYPLLRAWLIQEIFNTKSQLTVQEINLFDEARVKEKLVRLEKMLRMIDLE
jgi:hypothetical protein